MIINIIILYKKVRNLIKKNMGIGKEMYNSVTFIYNY